MSKKNPPTPSNGNGRKPQAIQEVTHPPDTLAGFPLDFVYVLIDEVFNLLYQELQGTRKRMVGNAQYLHDLVYHKAKGKPMMADDTDVTESISALICQIWELGGQITNSSGLILNPNRKESEPSP